MAWSNPRTWVANELVTAALMNQELRDNLEILKTNINDDGSINISDQLCQGRLTLTASTPVTVSDVTATTLRFTPYTGIGNKILIYNGTVWTLATLTELTIGTGGLSASTNYDVFVDYNGGSLQLVLLAWSSATARVALATQDGIYVKGAGDTDHLFVGSVRTNASTQFEDSLARRYVWNMWNRRWRPMRVLEATASWGSGTNDVWRALNNSSANALDFITGLNEQAVLARAMGGISQNRVGRIAIGLDSTTSPVSGCSIGENSNNVSPGTSWMISIYTGFPGLGRHQLHVLENADTAATWYGNGNPGGVALQSGIWGELWG